MMNNVPNLEESYCGYCGQKCDSNFIRIIDAITCYCDSCSQKINTTGNYFKYKWNKIDVNNYLKYHDYAQKNFRPIFERDAVFQGIHIDSKNGLFYFGDGIIDDNTLILSRDNVSMVGIDEFYKDLYGDVSIRKYQPTSIIKSVSSVRYRRQHRRMLIVKMRIPEFSFLYYWYENWLTQSHYDGKEGKFQESEVRKIIQIEEFFKDFLNGQTQIAEETPRVSDYANMMDSILANEELLDEYTVSLYNRRMKRDIAQIEAQSQNVNWLRYFSV